MRLRPLSIFGQILIVAILAMVVTQAVAVLLIARQPPPDMPVRRLSDIVEQLRKAQPGEVVHEKRKRFADLGNGRPPFPPEGMRTPGGMPRPEGIPEGMANGPPGFDPLHPPPHPGDDRPPRDPLDRIDRPFARPPRGPMPQRYDARLSAALTAALGSGTARIEVVTGDRPFHRMMREGLALDGDALIVGGFRATWDRPDGRRATLVASSMPDGQMSWRMRIIQLALVSLLAMLPLLWLIARRISRPVKDLAIAAERMGRDPAAPPVEIRGPAEMRAAGQALNDMQAHLNSYMDERLRMLAMIAHDLRSPLTRIAFRAEEAPDPARGRIKSDVAAMGAMLDSTIAFVRGAAEDKARVPVELRSLLESLVEDAHDLGADIRLEPGQEAVVRGDPNALSRLFGNLIDNARLYAGSATVTIALEGAEVVVRIADEGPGLPPGDVEELFLPFRRGEPARTANGAGMGLGLAIARDIVRTHGGTLTLAAGPGGGTVARVALPAGDQPRN